MRKNKNGRTVFARFYICKKTRAGKPGPYNPDKKDCKICRGGVSPPAGFPKMPRGRTLFARYYVCKKRGPGNPAPTILTKKAAKFVGAGSPRPPNFPKRRVGELCSPVIMSAKNAGRGANSVRPLLCLQKTRAGKPGPYNPDKKDCKICRGGVSPPAAARR